MRHTYQFLRKLLKEKFEYWEDDIKDEDVIDLSQYDLKREISENKEFKLYRYMPPNYFNIRNIETQTIHLSPNGVMNDIFEGLPKFDSNTTYEQLQKLNDLAYMLCMTETKDNTVMWSHYAQKHEGFCVEYDIKRLKTDTYNTMEHLFPVTYWDKCPVKRDMERLIQSHIDLKTSIDGNEEYFGEEELDNILPLFLIKGKAWKYEKEWRIVYTKKQMYDIDKDELYKGNIKFECISGVYLGCRINPVIKENIIEICERISSDKRKIPVYQAKLSGQYKLEFDEL